MSRRFLVAWSKKFPIIHVFKKICRTVTWDLLVQSLLATLVAIRELDDHVENFHLYLNGFRLGLTDIIFNTIISSLILK